MPKRTRKQTQDINQFAALNTGAAQGVGQTRGPSAVGQEIVSHSMMAWLTPEQRKTEDDYQRAIAISSQGEEAVRKLMAEISPGQDWVKAAGALIRKRSQHIPHFMYEDPEFGGTVCFPPIERPLRRILHKHEEQKKAPPRRRKTTAQAAGVVEE